VKYIIYLVWSLVNPHLRKSILANILNTFIVFRILFGQYLEIILNTAVLEVFVDLFENKILFKKSKELFVIFQLIVFL